MDVLITAGATRNPVDAIRYISAGSTGTTGVLVARAVRGAGLRPYLLASEEASLRDRLADDPVAGETFASTRDLLARMERWVRDNPSGAVVHAAAVGDYEVARPASGKIPSGQDELTLRLVRAPKIADHVRGWGLTGPFVTFKAAAPETTADRLVEIAAAQRARTGSDLVFANVLGRLGRGVWLVDDEPRGFDARGDALDALVVWLVERAAG